MLDAPSKISNVILVLTARVQKSHRRVRVVEDTVSNKTTGVVWFVVVRSDRLAVSVVEILGDALLAQQLVRVEALDITTVVLVAAGQIQQERAILLVGKLVVKEDAGTEVVGDVEADLALRTLAKGTRGIVRERPFRRLDVVLLHT